MAVKEIKNYGLSVKSRLLNVAQSEDVSFQIVLTRYLQERLLYRLSVCKYRDNFILKGGALLYAHEQFMARPTLDLDLLGRQLKNDRDNVLRIFKEICAIDCVEDGVAFHADTLRTSEIALDKKYPGINVALTATLDSVKQDVSIDIGFGDIITPAPVELDYPTILEDKAPVSILAYSIETIIAEKFQTVIERSTANSRMKDFYDLYTLLNKGEFDTVILKEAMTSTFTNRQTSLTKEHPFFSDSFNKNQGLNTRWIAFMRKLKRPQSLSFEEVVSTIRNKIVSTIDFYSQKWPRKGIK